MEHTAFVMKETGPWSSRNRLAGSLVGLLVGDALGVPYEFHAPQAIPALDLIEFEPPQGFARAHAGTPSGTWSDDGAQALVLLDSLLARQGLDVGHFADGLVRWSEKGFCAVDARVFDMGIQTRTALSRLSAGVAPEKAGPAGERDNGNGSLMRVLPLALWHTGTDGELVSLAIRQSLPTHGHVRAQIACAQYCLWVRGLLNDAPDAWDTAARTLQPLAASLDLPAAELALVLDPANARTARGSGYVVDTLWSARRALEESASFETCVKRAIALGNDTDTTAAVAGGAAGALYGLSEIPLRWRDGLRGDEILRPLLDALLQRRVARSPPPRGARTSASHPLHIAELPAGNGLIGITLCPGKKQADALSGMWHRELELDLGVIRAWGAVDLVSLIEPHEMTELRVEDRPHEAQLLGISWHHLPIVDGQAPGGDFEQSWAVLEPALVKTLSAGGRVVVHCKGGLGRAGTVAARLLMRVEPGLEAADAIRAVRAVRPGAIESIAQERYLERLAAMRL